MRYRLLASRAASACQFLTRIPYNQLLFLLQLRENNQREVARVQVKSEIIGIIGVVTNLYNGFAV